MAVKSFITLAPAQPLNGFQYLGSTDIRSQIWMPLPLEVEWGWGGGQSLKIVHCLNEKINELGNIYWLVWKALNILHTGWPVWFSKGSYRHPKFSQNCQSKFCQSDMSLQIDRHMSVKCHLSVKMAVGQMSISQ
jgi:hypothetical protein